MYHLTIIAYHCRMNRCILNKNLLIAFLLFNILQPTIAQPFTKADTLRGSNTAERSWWDVQRYDITVTPDFNTKSIKATCGITYKVLNNSSTIMQIDLQSPLTISSITQNGKMVAAKQVSPFVYHIQTDKFYAGNEGKILIEYSGTPREAVRPPWDGGWIWKKDSLGRPWMSVACQGLGASVWYPCKDYQADEPDRGASLTMIVADTLKAIANGRLIDTKPVQNRMNAWKWEVVNPINNYNIIPYIGMYENWQEIFEGEKGKLDINYWTLDYHKKQAEPQFKQVKQMLQCFEKWMGPYPFYEDGYKLIEAPHLGMEHQSAVAYGNGFKNGYRGTDLSGSGWGLLWDFIIIHESGHEWFGNNITTNDIADMWVHEGFTNYTETLFTEYMYGEAAGNEYNKGIRKSIKNDIPIKGAYGVNSEGSGDMYYKGSNMLHTIRHVINNTEKWRNILRGLQSTFYHQTVDSKQVEAYINTQSGINFNKVYEQYLSNTMIPQLSYYHEGKNKICMRWDSCIAGFNMPLVLKKNNAEKRVKPITEKWVKVNSKYFDAQWIENNFYIRIKEIKP